jgi:hypothetical protein
VCAQEIPYGTGQWDRATLGDQRAVVAVTTDAEAVCVHIPWRRHDTDPAKKALIVVDAESGRILSNVYPLEVNREYGDILFQPLTGKGKYYVYYMPFKTTGTWYFPNTEYLLPQKAYDPHWLERAGISGGDGAAISRLPAAHVVAFEAINDFNSFYPMEVTATRREKDSLAQANQEKDFLVFPEDRRYPIRMEDDIPYRWVREGVTERFSGLAMRGEFYVYQLGVFAAFKDVRGMRLTFSDLVSDKGDKIPAQAIRCFNLGGKDWLGNAFVKEVSVEKGKVQALWVGVDIGAEAKAGSYSGTVIVGAAGVQSRTISVQLRVRDEVIPDRGYDDLFREARLNWLDSDIGLDDSVFKPFTPVRLKGRTVSVLGRSLRFDASGLPASVVTTFTPDNQGVNGSPTEILGAPMQFKVWANGKSLTWKAPKSGPATVTPKTGGSVTWTARNVNPSAIMEVRAKMECDGYVNYQITLKATRDVTFDDIRLSIPYNKSVARYMMGMGRKGGYRPTTWDWKWEQDRANNMEWVGDVHAGLQCKLKNITPSWNLYQFDQSGPYKDWSNGGKGGARFGESGDLFTFSAFTGAWKVKKGQILRFNFGLLITPLKPLDNAHWVDRYFQSDPPVSNWIPTARKMGADIINVHQGNELNPYINYPFCTVDALRDFATAARKDGIRTKIYYTIRELSNHTTELWALRSLGHEIFTKGASPDLADQFSATGTGGYKMSTGGSWLVEHLQYDYDPAWHSPLANGDWDMAIHTQGLSRWHNYYLEGLNWVIRHTGTRGLYLDGVGYDREIMKRVRKVMDRAADSCLIDFHSGCNYEPPYGMNSAANEYMELFPYINSLWLGEGYNYNETPDYYLVEISGIPFGLYGEMLNGCGNAYRGMVYGMTSRPGWLGCDPSGLWKEWDLFGIKESAMTGYWDPGSPVTCSDTSVKVTLYRRPGKVMIAYASWANRDLEVRLDVNWKQLGIDPGHVGITAPYIAEFQEQEDYGIPGLQHLRVPQGKGGIIVITDTGR